MSYPMRLGTSLSNMEWRFQLPSTLEAIEAVCVEFRLWIAHACAGLNAFSAELLFREALTNSVVHGGGDDPTRQVSCVLRAGRGRLLIAIQDQGEGFDWRAASGRSADSEDTGGRGLDILRHYASSVRFNSKGSAVTLVKKF